MEEFRNFIFKLFQMYGYTFEIQFGEWGSLFKHKQKYDYWIVATDRNAFKEQSVLFSALTSEYKEKYPCASKNTSLLLLIEQNNAGEVNQESGFVAIENDPLYFKKYVLPFDMTSFHQLLDKIGGSCERVEECIMHNDTFDDLRNGNGYARLLYTIIHKLPFIPIKTIVVSSIDNAVLYSSPAMSILADSIGEFPEKESQQDTFIENLIREYENGTD